MAAVVVVLATTVLNTTADRGGSWLIEIKITRWVEAGGRGRGWLDRGSWFRGRGHWRGGGRGGECGRCRCRGCGGRSCNHAEHQWNSAFIVVKVDDLDGV